MAPGEAMTSGGNSESGSTATSLVPSSTLSETIQFYSYPQALALELLLPILRLQLPISNPIYNRFQAPHNTPDRHCLFAATFPPNSQPIPEIYTIVFSDRSRRNETQIWAFNSLSNPIYRDPLSPAQTKLLQIHVSSLLTFLKNTVIPEAPGHPFDPTLFLGCFHSRITSTLVSLPSRDPSRPLISYNSAWNHFIVPTKTPSLLESGPIPPPEPFTVTRVLASHLPLVISTSSIPRSAANLMLQPSLGLLTPDGSLVAWAFIGLDGSLATLYVMPEYRGKGLATYVARELARKLGEGGFADMGYSGDSGFVHGDVFEGNTASERVMKALEGRIVAEVSYTRVDSDAW
ncbi:hypothetical protein CJF31_00000214 [Rutstroemia sp. NJR-2017a BVV2]|nr:hypothetical protein CJF31_00000214 [Rutstroemia sp. NJR-2017a BVV2]